MRQLLFTPHDRKPTDMVRVETHAQRAERLRGITAVFIDLLVERDIHRDKVYSVWWKAFDCRYDITIGIWSEHGFSHTEERRIRRDLRAIAAELGVAPMFHWTRCSVARLMTFREPWGKSPKTNHDVLVTAELAEESA